jgi:hypothetical protein
LLGLLLPASLANLPSAYANGAVTVSIDAPAEVAEGSDFIAKVAITDVENFDIAQFDVTYNNTILHVTDVTAGDIAGTAIPIDSWGFIPPEQTPPDTGTIRVIANVPGAPGVSGSGYLAEIHFHVVGSAGDTSAITFSSGLLGDNGGHEITPVTWVDGSVHVAGAAVTYTLTVTSDGCCTITVGDLGMVDPGETEVFTDIPEGTSVELTANAAECCTFDGWAVNGNPVAGNPITVTMDANHSATATCSVPTYALTVDVAGNGDVTVNGETPASYPATYEFACGTVVNLEAIAAEGLHFANWSGDLSGSTNPTTVTMDGNYTIQANFETAPTGGGGLSSGAIAGIVIGSCAAAGLIYYFAIIRRRRKAS